MNCICKNCTVEQNYIYHCIHCNLYLCICNYPKRLFNNELTYHNQCFNCQHESTLYPYTAEQRTENPLQANPYLTSSPSSSYNHIEAYNTSDSQNSGHSVPDSAKNQMNPSNYNLNQPSYSTYSPTTDHQPVNFKNLRNSKLMDLSMWVHKQENKPQISLKDQYYTQTYTPSRLSQISVEIHNQDPKKYYNFIKQIGQGGSGIIYLVQNYSNSYNYVIKEVKIRYDNEREQLENEIKITQDMKSDYIISYYEFYDYKNSIWIVEELMSCALTDMILDIPGQIPEHIISYVLKSILIGISDMHRLRRIHRDIKSDNILISDYGNVKLADLGFAAQLDERQPNRNTMAGTLLWMPPEILMGNSYNHKVDIWSLGIVGYELALGEPPYYREQKTKISRNIVNLTPPVLDQNRFSQNFCNFVSSCLVKDPQGRPEASLLLSHPFIFNCQTTTAIFYEFFYSWKYNFMQKPSNSLS